MVYRIIVKNDSELKYIHKNSKIDIRPNKYPLYYFWKDGKYFGWCDEDCRECMLNYTGCQANDFSEYIDYQYFRKEKFKILLDE